MPDTILGAGNVEDNKKENILDLSTRDIEEADDKLVFEYRYNDSVYAGKKKIQKEMDVDGYVCPCVLWGN